MSQKDQEKIGAFIKLIRKEQGMTQEEFAQKLKTSQSAVARMESGGQNFTTKELVKISNVLGENIIALKEHRQDDFRIRGGKKLSGEITTNTSKNGALGLMCAALLNEGITTLHGVPHIEEINRMIEFLESIGVKINWVASHSITMQTPQKLTWKNMDATSASRMRSVLTSIGALIHLSKKITLPHAGGCKMGERTISAHRHALENFGVTVNTTATDYEISYKALHPGEFTMYEASDTGTISALIAAARIPGITTIHFAQQNYMVQDVIFFLEALGVKIELVGSKTIRVHGRKTIKKNIEHWNSEDPIESMMFMAAALVTQSKLKIKKCPIEFLRLEILKLEKMGMKYALSKQYVSANKQTALVDITIHPSRLIAVSDKLHALPYPGINTDNLPFFVPVATQAQGLTLVHDWMWENRAIYFTELNRLGASIQLADPHRVYIEGPTKLTATEIVCPPALRPSTMILVAMLGAEGTSMLRNVYSIKRGYENIVERLNSIGADIELVKGF
jgi:UDP-N-acetylglucosamine 1-carboxyvinyltransferase